ncbi:hypothetical protein [Nostoc sp. TCL26-01]|uniref:hypothetical protein n=1 Tax=Nostoc sp. TCL26-01 TaxID=2576904 RepID=UPI0015C07CCC|nr:hypothetical protein [Nostoc sp. TCL26-01]QLE57457.1 hypothetical protein FD725_19220 [Nostoc sp. TCL26-01]
MIDSAILVLDDDERWLALHERRLQQAGFRCHSTQDATDAIKIAKTNSSIKFALIDEILYVPPVPVAEEQRELQRWQGKGVIREISTQRPDMKIIVVTAAPVSRSHGDNQLFRQETAKLRRQKGVIDIIHKSDIDDDLESSYGWLIDLLKQPDSSEKATITIPKVLIGLGVQSAVYEVVAEELKMAKKQYLPIAAYLKIVKQKQKTLDELWNAAEEKSVLLEMRGSKKLDQIKEIKTSSSAFKILAFLAKKTVLQHEVIIREQDYHCSRRKLKRQVDNIPKNDPLAVKDFAFGHDTDGRLRLRTGVQLEGSSNQNSPLKVAISRLRDLLSKVNVGRADKLLPYEQEYGGYQPGFELGIVLYKIKKEARS